MKLIRSQFQGEIRYSNNLMQTSRGVMVGFNRKFDISKIGKSVSYDHGNMLLQAFSHSGRNFLMVTIYGPNDDKPDFYEGMRKAVIKFTEANAVDHLIIQGDFNLALNAAVDTSGYQRVNNARASEKLKLIMEEFDLQDAWRVLHPNEKRFTYRQRNTTALIENGLPPVRFSSVMVRLDQSDHTIYGSDLTWSQ